MPRGKKQCPECSLEFGARKSVCDCGYIFSKQVKKTIKSKPEKKINKREILFRLVEKPKENKRFFFMREMKFLNDLSSRYSLEFLGVVTFSKKFKSLAYLVSPKLKGTMDIKWRAFNYRVDKNKYQEYNIGEKTGQDIAVKKQTKTTKDFLNE